MKKEVIDYLINEKNYSLDEILSNEVKRAKGYGGADYPVEVKFVDEPNVYYQYIKRDGMRLTMKKSYPSIESQAIGIQ